MDSFERRYQRFRAEADAPTTLDTIAGFFLFCGFAFWAVAFWQLLSPPAILSLLSIQSVVLAFAFALAAPLLLSMLVPTTPAGQLLQKTQWATIGFVVVVLSALYLLYESEYLIEAWLSLQPGIAEAHVSGPLSFARQLAIVLTIAFVIIPALAWVQLSPEKWARAVQQAHQVKKLELQQKGELAIVKASLVRAETLAAIGWANLLPLEKEEAVKSLRGLLMASSDSMRAIVRTMGVSADLERSIMGDAEIAGVLDYVTQAIDIVPSVERPAGPRDVPAADQHVMSAPHQDAAPALPPPRSSTAGISAPQRPAAPRSAPQRYAVEYDTARQLLSGTWSVHALGDVLGVAERTARDRLNAWIDEGWAAQSDTKGRFYFTERGGAQ